MSQNSFGKYIRELRKEKSISTHTLAELSGVSQSYISHLETGRKKNVPSPEILKKLAGPLGVPYSLLMVKADYWGEHNSKEDRNVLEGIHNRRSKTIERIKTILKALADDDGIFPNELHRELFDIIGGVLHQQIDGQYRFEDWYNEYLQLPEEEKVDLDTEEAYEEFNKYYNYFTLRNGIQEYNEKSKSLEDIQHELIALADKHGIELQATPLVLTNVELGDLLSNESITIRYNGKLISPTDRYRIIGFLDAISIINE